MFWYHVRHIQTLKKLEINSEELPIRPMVGDVLDLQSIVSNSIISQTPELAVFAVPVVVAQVIIRANYTTQLSDGKVLREGGFVVLRVGPCNGASMRHAGGGIPK